VKKVKTNSEYIQKHTRTHTSSIAIVWVNVHCSIAVTHVIFYGQMLFLTLTNYITPGPYTFFLLLTGE